MRSDAAKQEVTPIFTTQGWKKVFFCHYFLYTVIRNHSIFKPKLAFWCFAIVFESNAIKQEVRLFLGDAFKKSLLLLRNLCQTW